MGNDGRERRTETKRQFRKAMSPRIAAGWEEVWELLPKALEGDDPEAVHAARVASRRLRAAMDGAAEAFPKPWYRSLHTSAKRITRTLGHVRDQDVLLEKLAADREGAEAAERLGIDRLIERITSDRDDARSAMRTTLRRSRVRRMRKASRARFPVGRDKAARRRARRRKDGTTPNRARRQIEERSADLLRCEPIIPDANAVEELHDARIAVKRLRYTLELFERGIGDEATRLIQETKGLQEVLGNLHDLDVSIQLVSGELDGQRAATDPDPGLVAGLEAIVRRDERTRQEAHRAVVACWESLMANGFRERLGHVAANRESDRVAGGAPAYS